MVPEGQKLLEELINQVDDGKVPETAIPRMFYLGHKVLSAGSDEAHWQCVNCSHEWTAVEGWKCPKCFVLRQPPRWECKDCGNEWYGSRGNFCSLCGKPKESYLIKPVEFDVGPPPVMMGKLVGLKNYDTCTVRVRIRYTGKGWAITKGPLCLSKGGKWLYSSLPSERTEEFIKETRFPTMLEAFEFYKKWKYDVLKHIEENMDSYKKDQDGFLIIPDVD